MKKDINNPLDGTKYEKSNVYQSNKFLEGNKTLDNEESNSITVAQRGMSINESRLFFITLLEIMPQLKNNMESNKKEAFELKKIPANVIINIFGGHKEYYSRLRNTALSLFNLKVKIKDGEKGFHYKRIFDEMKFGPEYGGLIFRFAEAMRPELYELNENYTKIAGKTIFSLSSTAGIRLLELMLEYQNIAIFKSTGVIERSFTVESFKEFFDVSQVKAYSNIYLLKKKVIYPAMMDINKMTGYNISVEETFGINVETGRKKTDGFLFKMTLEKEILTIPQEGVSVKDIYREKTELKPIDPDDPNYDLIDKLRSYGIGKIIANRLVKNYDGKRILDNVKYSLEMENIKNLAAYIRSAIENDYCSQKNLQMQLFSPNGAQEKRKEFEEYLKKVGLNNGEVMLILYDLDSDYRNHKLSNQSKDILNSYKIDEISLEEAFSLNDLSRVKIYT